MKIKRILSSVLLAVLLGSHAQIIYAQALENPITTSKPAVLIGRFIASIIPFLGAGAVIMFVVGAIHWILSSGNPDSVKKGRDTVVWAVLGSAVAIGAYVGLKFIIQVLTGNLNYT